MAQSRIQNLSGNENAEDYVRSYVPQSRWGDTWRLVKSNFSIFLLINLLTMLFFLPAAAVIFTRASYVAGLAAAYPFSGNLGISFTTPSTVGLAESITLSADMLFFGLLVVSGLIAAVGLAGCGYAVKKMIATNGEFTVKGYFRGVKTGYLSTVIAVTAVMVMLYGTVLVGDWADLATANGAAGAGPVAAKVFMIIGTVLVGLYAAWFYAVGISYKVKMRHIFKNAFWLLIGTALQSVFMLSFALVPAWLIWSGAGIPLMLIICLLFLIAFGFVFCTVVWMAFVQWVFDAFMPPAVAAEKPRAKKKAPAAELPKPADPEDEKRELLAAGRSELICKPIKPIDVNAKTSALPAAFTREDMAVAAAVREDICAGVAAYYEQHKDDPKYVEYNKLFADREKVVAPVGKKNKNKKISAENLLR